MTSTWREALTQVTESLGEDHEARIVIEEVALEPLSSLMLHIDDQMTTEQQNAVAKFVERRRNGEPLQHIVGLWPFRTLELVVDSRALVPRPETEMVVEQALQEIDRVTSSDHGCSVLDLGTGTGAIALSIAAERPRAKVIGVDRSKTALDLARANRSKCGGDVAARVGFVLGDFYGAFGRDRHGTFHAIVSNPPYIAEAEWPELDPAVRDFDPYEALVSGPTGFEAIEAVIDGAPVFLARPGVLVVEIAPHQSDHATERATEAGASSTEIFKDLAGRDRGLIARW